MKITQKESMTDFENFDAKQSVMEDVLPSTECIELPAG
jgi:hypothetical protein